MNAQIIARLVNLQREFADLYKNPASGLEGVSDQEIQLEEEVFAIVVAQMDGFPGLKVQKQGGYSDYYNAWVEIDGVTFSSIGKREDFERAGLLIPEGE